MEVRVDLVVDRPYDRAHGTGAATDRAGYFLLTSHPMVHVPADHFSSMIDDVAVTWKQSGWAEVIYALQGPEVGDHVFNHHRGPTHYVVSGEQNIVEFEAEVIVRVSRSMEHLERGPAELKPVAVAQYPVGIEPGSGRVSVSTDVELRRKRVG